MSSDVQSVVCRFSLVEVCRCSIWQGKNYVEGQRVKLAPIMGEPFGSATPGGSLEMVIANPNAAEVFVKAKLGTVFEVTLAQVAD